MTSIRWINLLQNGISHQHVLSYNPDLYKAEELCGLSVKPKINDIDWNVLQDYYRKFLNPFIYQYDIAEFYSIKVR